MLKAQTFYQFLSRLSKREKTVFYAACFFVILTLFDRLIVYPIYSKISSLNNEIKEKESAIVRDMRIFAQKDKILNEAKRYESFTAGPEAEEEAVTLILKEIENIASKSSLYIIEMKPAGIKEDKNKIKKFIVNLVCEGPMEQIMGFMYSIENFSMLLTIERYQISPKGKESSIVQCSMIISRAVIH
jgi:Tfp pilus assembly protein PilO